MDRRVLLFAVPGLACFLYANLDELSPGSKDLVDENLYVAAVGVALSTLYCYRWPLRARDFVLFHVASVLTAGVLGDFGSIVGPFRNVVQSTKLFYSAEFADWDQLDKVIAFCCEMASTSALFVWCHGDRSWTIIKSSVPPLVCFLGLFFTIIMTGIDTQEPNWRYLNLRQLFK